MNMTHFPKASAHFRYKAKVPSIRMWRLTHLFPQSINIEVSEWNDSIDKDYTRFQDWLSMEDILKSTHYSSSLINCTKTIS